MNVTVKNASRALAVGLVLAAAGAAPAWSQTYQGPYAGYYQGNQAQWYPLPDGGASAHPYTGR